MTKLVDLNPKLTTKGVFQTLDFRCPLCRRGAVTVDIWSGKHGDVVLAAGEPPHRLWHAEQGPHRDWDTLSISPSIDATNQPHRECPGWHGFITNGECLP